MIHYQRVASEDELTGILQLQRQNLPAGLSEEEMRHEGFVTVSHNTAMLRELNRIEPHLIAREDNRVIAYLLTMTEQSQNDIPVLQPMFRLFLQLPFGEKKVSDYRYIVVGQVCVDKAYRSRGILDACYAAYREAFQKKYDFAITEIAAANLRSLRAHQRVGFREWYRYTAPDGMEWVIVVWDWNGLAAENASTSPG